jgi:hypothetical protein
MHETNTSPLPFNNNLTKWEEWGGVVWFIIIFTTSSIGIWHLNILQPFLNIILLGFGIFTDLMSLIARIHTALTGRYSSGFFVVGFVFYLWAWVSYPHAIF